ncbi:MAG: malate/lactate/ureidoglycolate dehydrogenase [Pseudomonadota bacterium]|nr:malate/lactate/ureidoglycolate dehydrogenase [Pseudomonadota bacterium]
MTVLIEAKGLEAFVRDIFVAAGCSGAEAQRVAVNLVDSNLTGHDSHGVIHTPRYVIWLTEGKLFADREVSTLQESDSLLVLDGNYGLGQTVGPVAVERGIAKAKASGLCVVALRHAGHLGRIGLWAEMAAEAGQVSIHFVNVAGSVLVAPFGGVDRRMSTAPVAIGMPTDGKGPVILDFATSLVAEGKVLVAAKGGKSLPDDALIGPDGTRSGDPALLYGDADPARTPDQRKGPGAIRAMGEHKGSGLALMCELLAGALTGSGCTGPGFPRVYNGMLSIYMSAERFGTEDFCASEARRYVDFVKSSRPEEADGEVLVPGEPERRYRAERLKYGVPLADDAWASIAATAESMGVKAPAVGKRG